MGNRKGYESRRRLNHVIMSLSLVCVPHMSGRQVNTDNYIKMMINFVHLAGSIDVGSRNHIRLNHVIMSLSLAHASYVWWSPNQIKAVIDFAKIRRNQLRMYTYGQTGLSVHRLKRKDCKVKGGEIKSRKLDSIYGLVEFLN